MGSGGVKLVLASNNAGKLAELRALLAPLGLSLVAQGELGISEADETGLTFVENAIGKARHASRACGRPAIADDSGLVVPALGGAPGIRSARYAGRHGDDDANNRMLLSSLTATADRRAFFHCAIALLRHAEDPVPIIASGSWWGEIASAPRGNAGFGYDPLFEVPGFGRTAAELDAPEKNRLSHRAKAIAALIAQLERHPL